MFAMNPKMIMIGGTLLEALPMIVTAIVGLVGIGGGFIGYLNGKLSSILRLVSFAGGLLLVVPGTMTDILGIVLVGAVYGITWLKKKNATAAQ